MRGSQARGEARARMIKKGGPGDLRLERFLSWAINPGTCQQLGREIRDLRREGLDGAWGPAGSSSGPVPHWWPIGGSVGNPQLSDPELVTGRSVRAPEGGGVEGCNATSGVALEVCSQREAPRTTGTERLQSGAWLPRYKKVCQW